MGRLRELLDELKARRAAAVRDSDASAGERWTNEGGQGSPGEEREVSSGAGQ